MIRRGALTEFTSVNGELLPSYRTMIDELFPPLRVVPLDSSGLAVSLRSAGSRALQITDIAANAHLVERRPGAAANRDEGFYKVSLQLTGTSTMMQGNRETVLSPGTITLYDTSREYDLASPGDFRFIVAMFPKDALALPSGVAGELAAHPIHADSGVGAVFAALLRALDDNLALLLGSTGSQLETSFLSVLSTMIGEVLSVPTKGVAAGRRTALLQVLAYIEDHLGDPDLTPATIAAAQFVSLRHLYNVFAPTGVSIAHWIRQRRLEGARRDLADPLTPGQSIGAVAARWGFADSAYFSRVFKARYGQTPREWQQACSRRIA